MSTLQDQLDQLAIPGELYEVTDEAEHKIRCYACGHRCVIRDGGRGVCKVRFNKGGVLYVPRGYVGALQVDPIEKKPFNHLDPGVDVISFGMLGCDLHCSYCFVPETPIITEHGVVDIADLFAGHDQITQPDGAEIAFPKKLRVIAGSGQLRQVTKVFKHPYDGQISVIKPYYLPELRCTPDHRIYATTDPEQPLTKVRAHDLTPDHLLAIPLHCQPLHFIAPDEIGLGVGSTSGLLEVTQIAHAINSDFYLIPIREITSEPYQGYVYNLEVEEEHNYLANFLLVSNCQNWEISQHGRDQEAGRDPQLISPAELIQIGKARGAKGIASTYNEPLITSEWAVEVFKEAKRQGLRTMYISNGNGTPDVINYLRPHLDGYKIDLKSMRDKNYRQLGAVLQTILDTIKLVKEVGLWLEIVTLVIPGFNDSHDELWDAARYIASISPDIPWHVTAFHPDYRMTDPPRTTSDMLIRAAEIGAEAGLKYVYAGNLPGHVGDWEHTRCPTCQTVLIRRHGFYVLENRLKATRGDCPKCGTHIPGIWV